MVQVVRHQRTQEGRLTQKDATCHHHLSGLGKDKFRGLLIASILSAGILLTLLLTVAGKGGLGQGQGHLSVGIDDHIYRTLDVDGDGDGEDFAKRRLVYVSWYFRLSG